MIRKIDDADIRAAFGTRQTKVDQFRAEWGAILGSLFQCPGAKQIKTWMQISGYDFELLTDAMHDLASRARSPLSPDGPWEHAIKHFSATLIRKTRARYGEVRPSRHREAA